MLLINDWRQIKIGRDDRATLIGKTGTGKTTLARFLLQDNNKQNSVVYNNKPSPSIRRDWVTTMKEYEDFRQLEDADESRLIYTPPLSETVGRNAEYLQDRFFWWIYERQYTRLYVDEASALKGGTNPSEGLLALITRGRELGISVMIGMQRCHRVPMILMSEAEHFFIFRERLHHDRVRIYELTNITPEEQLTLGEHEFFYYNDILSDRSQKLVLDSAVIVSPLTRQHHNGERRNARSTAVITIPLQYAAT